MVKLFHSAGWFRAAGNYGKQKRLIILLIAIGGVGIFFSSCSKPEGYYLTEGEIFKTTVHIKYKYPKDLREEIFARLDSFDLSLNPFNKKSILYRVNHNEEVEVDDWFITVFNKAKEISELTGGAYDITCAPLVNLWGFGFEKMDEINSRTIDSLKQFVGYQKVWIEGRKVMKADPRLQLDASSIAKGYACDVIAQLFDSYGIKDYMVEIGGEIHAKGKNPQGKTWSIEIEQPIDDVAGFQQKRQELIYLKDRSIATSGNYRNFYLKDGKKYAHIIHPLTGYPVEGNLLSVSVIYPDCMTADAFATAFMVVGMDSACLIANRTPEMEYLFIYSDENDRFMEKKSANFDKLKIK